MKRTLTAAVLGLALLGQAAPPASAATGATVSNANVSAVATSRCSAGWVDATVHVRSRKNYQTISVRSAGLYDGAYGSSYYRQLDNASEFANGSEGLTYGNYYYGQQVSYRWSEPAPRGGDQVVFFVSAPNAPVLPVKVSCPT